MSTDANQSKKPPYLSFTTLKNFITSFKESVVPGRIDKSLMLGQSGSTQSYMLAALKFFDLIDDEGAPLPKLHELVEADSATGKVIWKNLIEPTYAPILGGLDLSRATAGQLQEKFAELGLNGETLRKSISFFVAAADEAGMSMSPQLKPNTRGISGGSRKRRAKAVQKNGDEGSQDAAMPLVHPSGKGTSATLLLDVEGTRKITLHGPPSITTLELERLKAWVAVQFIVEDSRK